MVIAISDGKAVWLKRLALLTLCLAVLMAQLDTSVVNLAVRPIADYFMADVSALQWVVAAYNLTYAVLLLTGGLLADLYGRRLMFIAGAAIFTGASVLCAAAPSIAVLIGGRALAGVGAALLLPASLATIRVVWPDPVERGKALGIWAACNGLSLAIGPTLGGMLIQWFGWRGIFGVVVPVGVAAMALGAPALPESADPHKRRFDAVAQLLGGLTIGGLALASIEGRSSGVLASGAVVVACAAFAVFCRVEARQGEAALVPLEMFHARSFCSAILATTGMTFGMYGVLFLQPLVWQSSGVLTAAEAGLALVPMALVFVLVSPFSGAMAERVGQRRMTSGGVGLIGGGLCVLAMTGGSGSVALAEVGLGLTGLGMGLATGPLFGVAVGSVSSARSGTAAALINVARMVGATLGVAMLGSVFAGLGGGAAGLRFAMLLGGMVQLACAAVAWKKGGIEAAESG